MTPTRIITIMTMKTRTDIKATDSRRLGLKGSPASNL